MARVGKYPRALGYLGPSRPHATSFRRFQLWKCTNKCRFTNVFEKKFGGTLRILFSGDFPFPRPSPDSTILHTTMIPRFDSAQGPQVHSYATARRLITWIVASQWPSWCYTFNLVMVDIYFLQSEDISHTHTNVVLMFVSDFLFLDNNNISIWIQYQLHKSASCITRHHSAHSRTMLHHRHHPAQPHTMMHLPALPVPTQCHHTPTGTIKQNTNTTPHHDIPPRTNQYNFTQHDTHHPHQWTITPPWILIMR